MFHSDSVPFIVRRLALGVATIDIALVAYILYRRALRRRFYAARDAAQARFSTIVNDFLTGRASLDDAFSTMNCRGVAEDEAIKGLLLQGMNNANRSRSTELLFRLGFVETWARAAFGKERAGQLLEAIKTGRPVPAVGRIGPWRRFRAFRALSLSRAIAVARLGRLSEQYAQTFLVEGLQDPSSYVGRLSVAAMGRNQFPNGVPLLLEQLKKAVQGESELPVRSIRTALVRYPLAELKHYVPVVNHGSGRLRFLAVDTIREICKGTPHDFIDSAFPSELRDWFLCQAIQDPLADVRARSAPVIACFRNPQATAALQILLRDENEFVRLHAVRACADQYYSPLIADLVQRLMDRRWRVREAAVRTLTSFPDAGRQRLEEFFLATTDRYASEQIADELQRSGAAVEIAMSLAAKDPAGKQSEAVCAKFAQLGMSSLLLELLQNKETQPPVRELLLKIMARVEVPRLDAVLQRIAQDGSDPLQPRAQALLQSWQTMAAVAAEPN